MMTDIKSIEQNRWKMICANRIFARFSSSTVAASVNQKYDQSMARRKSTIPISVAPMAVLGPFETNLAIGRLCECPLFLAPILERLQTIARPKGQFKPRLIIVSPKVVEMMMLARNGDQVAKRRRAALGIPL